MRTGALRSFCRGDGIKKDFPKKQSIRSKERLAFYTENAVQLNREKSNQNGEPLHPMESFAPVPHPCATCEVVCTGDNLTNANCTSNFRMILNGTARPSPEVGPQSSSGYEPWQVVVIGVVCSVILSGTVLGNVLVCTAVTIVRKLRTPSNLLIVSLAVSDLLVALLDMPFATVYEVMGRWVLGQTVCDIWTSLDVLLCTASILNLCMISVDRYFVITKPFQYAMKRTPIRMLLMIAAAWTLSAVISIPPLFGWKAKPKEGLCVVSQAIGYQFYATIGAFYLPLTVMIIIYTRIYLVSYRIAQAEARSKPPIFDTQPNALLTNTAASASGSFTPLHKDSAQLGPASGNLATVDEENHNLRNGKQKNQSLGEILPRLVSASRPKLFPKPRLGRISSSNERKATKTLGVIMGAFTACWLPFFILALIKPFCRNPDTCIPHWLNSLFLWLGYTNSFLNPIIYARFNRDFRTPFRHILQCNCRDINSRLRSENFAEQFGPENRETARAPAAETFVRFSCEGKTVVKLK